MNAIQKYQIVQELGKNMSNAEWRHLIYDLEEHGGDWVIKKMVKHVAVKNPDILKKVWPCSKELLQSIVEDKRYSGNVLSQEDVDELLRGLCGGD